MGFVVLVKRCQSFIIFYSQNTNLVSVLSKICPNFAGRDWQDWWISRTLIISRKCPFQLTKLLLHTQADNSTIMLSQNYRHTLQNYRYTQADISTIMWSQNYRHTLQNYRYTQADISTIILAMYLIKLPVHTGRHFHHNLVYVSCIN